MFETLLAYGYDAKHSQLTSALYFKDKAGKMEIGLISGENTGSKRRLQYLKENYILIEISGPTCIHLDLFQQNRFLLNHVDLKIKLVQNTPNFSLMSDTNNNLSITFQKEVLRIRKVKISPSVIQLYNTAMQNTQ